MSCLKPEPDLNSELATELDSRSANKIPWLIPAQLIGVVISYH